MQFDIKPIRSKGHRSNPLKKCDLILKVALRQANFYFFVSPHEILKFKYFAIKIALSCFKLIFILVVYCIVMF